MTAALQNTSALILAGGMGTRLAALYPGVPKPMVPVAGEPFLEWLVRRIALSGMTDIIISTGYRSDMIADWAKNRKAFAKEKIRCVAEQAPLGTGGAIAHALPEAANAQVMIFNGDSLLADDLAHLPAAMEKQNTHGAIFVRKVEDASRYGSIEISEGRIKAFHEKKPGKGYVNVGIYLFGKDWLKSALAPGASSLETDVFPKLLKEGAAIAAVATDAPFIDIGTPETVVAASDFVTAHKDCFA